MIVTWITEFIESGTRRNEELTLSTQVRSKARSEHAVVSHHLLSLQCFLRLSVLFHQVSKEELTFFLLLTTQPHNPQPERTFYEVEIDWFSGGRGDRYLSILRCG
jgi:hypothetical protein